MEKAFPKAEKKTPKAKPASKVATKKMGSTGKVRSGYAGEKKAKASGSKGSKAAATGGELEANLDKFATHVGVDPAHVRKVAKRFSDHPGMKGKERFVGFMSSRFKEMHAKHGLDSAYWGQLYDLAAKSLRGS